LAGSEIGRRIGCNFLAESGGDAEFDSRMEWKEEAVGVEVGEEKKGRGSEKKA
jgi:hypothetical protein